MADDRIFRALADRTRRHLLDRLLERDGRSLTELESESDLSRFGVMKHLRILEEAALVTTRTAGREKHHFLNPIPIRLISDRWLAKYVGRRCGERIHRETARRGGSAVTTLSPIQTTDGLQQRERNS